ncbi:homeodomain-interacting protein kinase 2-like [Embiotoca jacksoni]|uniref:homeodomain-interacting protein kinase 2-like n=1 Tax=Embiotoca jacksoni TaxID=100190 RepID=UPI003703FF60
METSSSEEEAEWAVKLPEKYKVQKVLGEGGFGKVLQCWRTDTEETVAVKIPLHIDIDNKKEIAILKKLMCLNFDRCNIVKFFGWFHMSCGKALVFELLDICILDFIMNIDLGPFLLSDIRVIILQMAIALEALRTVGLIHADIKVDNIMMVDHRTRPFRVKLIDFGLTMYRSKAKAGMHVQTINYRAPEIFLGMMFSEAIDVWSLGCVMAAMLFSYPLFCKFDEFRETDKEYFGWFFSGQERRIQDESLDTRKELHLKSMDESEVEDGGRCFDLLKAMLKFNEAERIRPNQILTHPFITTSQHCSQ